MFRRPISLVFTLLLGCRGSMSADSRMDQDLSNHSTRPESAKDNKTESGSEAAKESDSAEHPLSERPLSEEEAATARAHATPEAATTASSDFALFGARHDFTVKDSSGAVACRCVSVLLGPPSSGKLEWRGEMPRTKPENQFVIALVPDSAACAGAPTDGGGASYWGYRVEGNDVVVYLEDWKENRPRTLGAIIPKPPVGGQVYVAPTSARLPYGKPASGEGGRCALGNPGPKRTEPLNLGESDVATDLGPEPPATHPNSNPPRPAGRTHAGRRNKMGAAQRD